MEQSEHLHRTGKGSRLNRQLEELAARMAWLAYKIRDLTIAAFKDDSASGTMRNLFETFREALTSDLTVPQFADMLAQTLSYGLFATWYVHAGQERLQPENVIGAISNTSPFLKQLFGTSSWPEASSGPLARYVDELIQLLEGTDLERGVANAHQCVPQEDLLIYFYEKFLEQYDPQLRELRGVYYTPEPVVSYIVRSVDLLLRSHFACQDGLATGAEFQRRVIVLDPACGTGVFLHGVVKYVREQFRKTGNAGQWANYVHRRLLPHLFGFELLLAPLAMAHLKLGMQLAALDLPEAERQNWASNIESGEHLKMYLANTLEKVEELVNYGEGQDNIAEGNSVAVVLGNPPYAGHSANKGRWINTLIEAYKEDCPELKKPAQAKWLSDDYVKFMRFAQWYIEQTGYGILAFITNHSYLDNPTFRGMRRSLLESFDDMYILDLHGNSKKKEQAPGGSKDENVFDIQQGVAISIFVKWRDASEEQHSTLAVVHHANLWGPREIYEHDTEGNVVLTGGKYAWLAEHDLNSTQWTILKPQGPFYLLAPQDTRYADEYEAGWKIPDIFRPNGDPAPGIVTCHDQFAISWSRGEAIKKVERLLATETEEEARRLFRLCSQGQWQYALAKSELARDTWQQETTEILYRPFDRRWTVFNRYVAVHRRERVMCHMLGGKNTGLTIGKAGQVIDQDEWDIVFCTRYITEFNLYRRGGNNLFPLYLYDDSSPGDRRANLAPEFVADFSARSGMRWVTDGRGDLQQTFGPEDVFAYMYAVFYSPAYRKRYAPFLKIDFPRLPLTANTVLFRSLCNLGERLIGLHLMERCPAPIASYPVAGHNLIESVRYVRPHECGEMGQVWINATQYFEEVPLAAWTYSIGGYQVCRKWLRDRRGRKLSDDELAHYQRIVAVLAETVRLMQEVDAVIEECGGWPI